MQKSHARQTETSWYKSNQSHFPPICALLVTFVTFWIQASSSMCWKDSNTRTFISFAKRKRQLGPVKMIKKALLHTSNVRYDEDTILFAESGKTPSSKGRSLMFRICTEVSAPLSTYRWVLGKEKVLFRRQKDFNYLSRLIDSLSITTSSHTSGRDVFSPSLSISWSLSAKIKEQLQSRSRKRELKGLLSLSTSPSFLVSRLLFKQLWRAEWSDAGPGQAVPSFTFPFTLFC